MRRDFSGKSRRSKWDGYDEGIYFVTVCTAERGWYLGSIENGVQSLSVVGAFLAENLQSIQDHYPDATVVDFVVMPNHFHAIFDLKRESVDFVSDMADAFGMSLCNGNSMRTMAKLKGRLSVVVGGVKSAVSKFANLHNVPFAWQPRFHDVVIRSSEQLARFRDYILANPSRWAEDEFYTSRR